MRGSIIDNYPNIPGQHEASPIQPHPSQIQRFHNHSQQIQHVGVREISPSQSSRIAKRFSNIPCPAHPEYFITNMCTAIGCLEPLCAECIGLHTSLHDQERTSSKIDTIYNKRLECLSVLKDQLSFFQTKRDALGGFSVGNDSLRLSCEKKIAQSKQIIDSVIARFFNELSKEFHKLLERESQKNNTLSSLLSSLDSRLQGVLSSITNIEEQLNSDDFISAVILTLSGDYEEDFNTLQSDVSAVFQNKQNDSFSLEVDERRLEALCQSELQKAFTWRTQQQADEMEVQSGELTSNRPQQYLLSKTESSLLLDNKAVGVYHYPLASSNSRIVEEQSDNDQRNIKKQLNYNEQYSPIVHGRSSSNHDLKQKMQLFEPVSNSFSQQEPIGSVDFHHVERYKIIEEHQPLIHTTNQRAIQNINKPFMATKQRQNESFFQDKRSPPHFLPPTGVRQVSTRRQNVSPYQPISDRSLNTQYQLNNNATHPETLRESKIFSQRHASTDQRTRSVSKPEDNNYQVNRSMLNGQTPPLKSVRDTIPIAQRTEDESISRRTLPHLLSSVTVETFSPTECLRKFLYFFQDNSKLFHFLDLETLSIEVPFSQKFQQIVLNISFKLPMYHRSIITSTGEVYLTGGVDVSSKSYILTSCYKLNYKLQSLESIASMHYPRSNHGIAYCDRYIYVAGGTTNQDSLSLDKCERYDTKSHRWEMISSLNSKCSGCSLSSFSNRFIFKFGGQLDLFTACNTIERYDILTNEWRELPFNVVSSGGPQQGILKLPSFAGASQINDDEIILLGGGVQNQKLSQILTVKMFSDECDIVMSEHALSEPGTFWQVPIVIQGALFALQNVCMDKSPDHCYFGKKRVWGFYEDGIRLLGADQSEENSSNIHKTTVTAVGGESNSQIGSIPTFSVNIRQNQERIFKNNPQITVRGTTNRSSSEMRNVLN